MLKTSSFSTLSSSFREELILTEYKLYKKLFLIKCFILSYMLTVSYLLGFIPFTNSVLGMQGLQVLNSSKLL